VDYGHVLGHRGLSHSLPFAALSAALLALVWQRHELATRSPAGVGHAAPSALRVWLYLSAAIASHGLLDALTNGGLGVAFFAPFDAERYFFPWQPIEVSPISVRRFFSARGWRVLQSELLVVWLPALALVLLASLWRRVHSLQARGQR
jgi:inner membrane protein